MPVTRFALIGLSATATHKPSSIGCWLVIAAVLNPSAGRTAGLTGMALPSG